jgi:hypothetical protein
MRRRRQLLLGYIQGSQEVDVSKAVRVRGKPRGVGDGITKVLVDKTPGQLIDRCPLAAVQTPQLAAAAGQLLLADPLGPASYPPDRRGQRGASDWWSMMAGQVA